MPSKKSNKKNDNSDKQTTADINENAKVSNSKNKTQKKKTTKNKTPKEKTSKEKNLKINAPKEKKTQPSSNEMTESRRRFVDAYKSNYLQFNTSKKIRKFIDNPDNDTNYLYSDAFNRITTNNIFGFELHIDNINSITVTFKLRDLRKKKEAIYAFGYYEEITHETILRDSRVDAGSDTIIRNFAIGGSYMSKDGEYRTNIISGANLRAIFLDSKLRNIHDDIKRYLKEKFVDRKITIDKDYFYPTDEKRTQLHINTEYMTYKLELDLLSLAWLALMINLDLNLIENNLNDKYQDIMLAYKDEDVAFYNSIKKTHHADNITKMRYLINHIKIGSMNISMTKLGQKLIPLSISEAQNPFDIRYKPWREYLISLKLSDFVVNYVSSGFFITNQWYYIKNTHKGLFDNEAQYEKMARSELAEQITNLLGRAKLFTHENMITKNSTQKRFGKELGSWMSNKFKVLSEKIQDPIDYAKEEIIMSDIALGFITEYVGRTFMDFIMLCKLSTYYNKLVGDPFSLGGYKIFAKYMFDMCYNLYCMNYRGGIIHGDLHLNNATIRASLYEGIRDIKAINNPTVLYVISDNDQYIFKTFAYNSCLIDFSRSIVLPDMVQYLHDQSLPKSYEITNNVKEFQDGQVERLLKLYMSYAPDSVANADMIATVIKSKFEAAFKLLTSADIYGFTKKLLTLFSVSDKDILKPHKLCIDLLEKINNQAGQFIFTEMNKLIYETRYENIVAEMDWPLYTIIKNCFSDFNAENNEIGNIIEAFNINNELTYSLTKLSKFPKYIADTKSLNKASAETVNIAIKDREKFEKHKAENMKIVNKIAAKLIDAHI